MAQYEMKLHGTEDGQDADLLAALSDYRDLAHGDTSSPCELRVSDSAEAETIAERLAALRDALGLQDRISYHVCYHDEGVGFCTGIVEK